MQVIFSSEVYEEVSEAQDFYENEVDGLGRAFVQILFESIQEISAIRKHPGWSAGRIAAFSPAVFHMASFTASKAM